MDDSMTSRGASTEPAPPVIDVLLVEDDEGDVIMVREAFEQRGPATRLHVVNDGIEAVAFLRRAEGYADAPRPDLILLDLNMPRMDGREVLAEVKADPALTAIPVVVLTTSAAQEDILSSYSLYANAYITKPADLDEFLDAVGKVDEFFGATVTLPN
ncbi:response regulator [Actinokineospora globicatena]|uniref:response regulator n=1 Tax=Actinokineospora globicatena TaxID=103729 RepID=UPI0020A3BCBE|nr:response regulator [Actinokineospora globicatena]MCP2303042.1 Response regulator receiver domain-containing protein [Actinokineospora globicatena]GLW79848.1 two-component system response regulator [Actinokineospora globicatena]GLW85742.1 two-component system response regulator [Actinokineospora globicatena]